MAHNAQSAALRNSSGSWTDNLSFNTKIAAPVLLVILTMSMVLWFSVRQQGDAIETISRVSEVHLPAVELLLQADRDLYQAQVAERTMLMTEAGSKPFSDLLDSHEENIGQAYARLSKYADLAGNAGPGAAQTRQLLPRLEEWKEITNEVVSILQSGSSDARKRAAVLSLGQSEKQFQAARDLIDQLTEIQMEQSVSESLATTEATKMSGRALLTGGLAGVALCSFLLLWLGYATTKRLRQVTARLQDIAHGDGDLTRRLEFESKDEVGQIATSFNRFADKIHDIVQSASLASDTVFNATREMAKGNNDLAQRTETQADGLQKTATSIDQITASMQQNADNAMRATDVAQSAKQTAQNGGQQVNQVINAMHDIADSSQKISEIVSVVDEIAFQTNLLALNAAVEAARAGDQGAGFAVVAMEVRNLAQRSADSANQIKALIEESLSKVDAGTKLADHSGQALGQLLESVNQVTTLISEISNTTSEQSHGIREVNGAIGQIEGVTQKNAALVQEAAVSTNELRQQAETLATILGTFKVNGQGRAPAPVRFS